MVSLDLISIVNVYSAMAVYALAFVLYAVAFTRRSRLKTPAENSLPEKAHAADGGRIVATAVRTKISPTRPSRPSKTARLATSLTVLAVLLHLVATVLRGVEANRLPWANMYEFSLTGTLIIALVYLLTLIRIDIRFVGVFLLGLILVLLGIATVNYYVPAAPLPPALQSYWLVIHVLVAMTATGYFALGFLLTIGQLLAPTATGPASRWQKLVRGLPSRDRLEQLAYRMNIVGFLLWTFTLIAGAIWAERAWGRYWGWDTKEVWTFIIWVVYAGYIHARATRGWRGHRSAWLSVIGFIAVMFNFGIVNVFFTGLHSYSGL
ncbi:c-type cytochrome biogenesis protein CcsB [Herbiconiux sp. YIM B11900]|uniref:c-type cytochrome biogenesis protein CcsB n=1 Tax=Herbiconiux sp. YIM B11900 TaxID=3404131 RepID=UPI003F83155A